MQTKELISKAQKAAEGKTLFYSHEVGAWIRFELTHSSMIDNYLNNPHANEYNVSVHLVDCTGTTLAYFAVNGHNGTFFNYAIADHYGEVSKLK